MNGLRIAGFGQTARRAPLSRTPLGRLWQQWRAARQARLAARALARLDARLLDDMGIPPAAARGKAGGGRGARWNAPDHWTWG